MITFLLYNFLFPCGQYVNSFLVFFFFFSFFSIHYKYLHASQQGCVNLIIFK